LSEIQRLIRVLRRPVYDPANPVYALPWVLHLAGDVHNPLHTTSRFSQEHLEGDQGGNLVYVGSSANLHALWDAAGGTDTKDTYVSRIAGEVAREYAANGHRLEAEEKNPRKWVEEGFDLARTRVYTFGPSSGTRGKPVVLPAGYRESARATARVQLAAAGFRLAAVLNEAAGR
jgi:hypothetical protein